MFTALALHSDNFIHCQTTKQGWMWITLSTKINWLHYLYWGSIKNLVSSGKGGAWEHLLFVCRCISLQPLQVYINRIKEFSTYSAGDLKCSTPNIHVDGRLDNWKVILGTALEGECNSLRELRRGGFLWLHYFARPDAKNWWKLERQDNSLAYHAALRIADVYYIEVYLFSEEATRVRRVVWCNKLLQQYKQNLYIYVQFYRNSVIKRACFWFWAVFEMGRGEIF